MHFVDFAAAAVVPPSGIKFIIKKNILNVIIIGLRIEDEEEEKEEEEAKLMHLEQLFELPFTPPSPHRNKRKRSQGQGRGRIKIRTQCGKKHRKKKLLQVKIWI